MRSILLVSFLLLTLCSLVFWGYVFWKIGYTPENHVGWNVLWALPFFILLAVLAIIHAKTGTFPFSGIILVCALVSCLAVVALYKFNILVPHEVWTARGMPKRPF